MFNKLQESSLQQSRDKKDFVDFVESKRSAKSPKRRWIPILMLSIAVLFLAGCTNKQDIPNGIKVTYQSWVGVVAVAVGLLATIGGWFAKNSGFRGWVFFIFALLGLIFFSPFGFVDHVTVTEEKINTQWGFWVVPTKHEFLFDEVQSVTLTEETKTTRRGRRTNYYLVFRLKDGSREKLIASNALMERATETIIARLATRGIPVVDRTR